MTTEHELWTYQIIMPGDMACVVRDVYSAYINERGELHLSCREGIPLAGFASGNWRSFTRFEAGDSIAPAIS